MRIVGLGFWVDMWPGGFGDDELGTHAALWFLLDWSTVGWRCALVGRADDSRPRSAVTDTSASRVGSTTLLRRQQRRPSATLRTGGSSGTIGWRPGNGCRSVTFAGRLANKLHRPRSGFSRADRFPPG